MDHRVHHHHRGGSEDQELIFNQNGDHHDQSYPCAYYVQSPSTLSHANSTTVADIRHMITANASASAKDDSAFQSPVRTETLIDAHNLSSSRGSNGQYFSLHAKKISYDARSHDTEDLLANSNNVQNRLVTVRTSHHDPDDQDEEEYYSDYYYGKKRKGGWWKMYFSYSNSDSSSWICLQISWRFFVSLIVSLLVFYVATRPPPPKLSLQIVRVGEYDLGEGVDGSGVATKLLSCNCSLHLIIDNYSKLFGLHIHPPTITMSFHHFTFALAHGPKMYAESGSRTQFGLSIGTRNKPMYGAGREMEDMLESGHGMPLLIHLRFTSTFRVLLHLINPKYHHQAHCLLILQRGYDKRHRTHPYNSTCTFT